MQNWHWRNSMKPVRFFALDARAAIPVVLLLVHFRPYTLGFAVIVMIVFLIAERAGLTFSAALRWVRSQFIGPRRPRIGATRFRRMTDYG